jgi:hypothetical protein
MITTTDNETVEKFGVGKEHEFRIKSTAKAFKILSSSLYTDKVQAIIREYSCNAYDAHIAAKNPAPFKVHLPNRLEPWFCIRDFGTGLSPKEINNVFTVYFESTKSDSNDYVGCLGLGSKSAFSYSDNFSVNSYFNGKKYAYTMYINEDGVPNVTLNGTTPTDEHNGLEITIGVRSNDFWSFSHNAALVYKYFKNLPEIVGEKISIEVPEYTIKGSSWGIRANGRRDVKIIMGNVSYALNNYHDDSLTEEVLKLRDLALDIYVDIGSVDVAASRESISFDKKTKLFIANKLTQIHKEINEQINTTIASCKYLYDAKLLLRELNGSIPYMSFESTMFNGTKLTTQYTYDSTKHTTFSFATLKNKSRRSSSFIESARIYFEPSRNEVFLFMDTRKYAKLRYKKLSQNGNNDTKYTVVKAGVTVDGKDMDHEQAKKDFIAFLGMNPNTVMKNMSELPFDKPAKKTYVSSTGTTRVVTPKEQVDSYNTTIGDWEIQPCIEEETNGQPNTYVLTKRTNSGTVKMVDDYYGKRNLINQIELLKKLGVPMPMIYGIKEYKITQALVKFPKLVKFDTWVEQKINEYIDKVLCIHDLHLMHQIEEMDAYPREKRTVKKILQNSFILQNVKVDDPDSQKAIDRIAGVFTSVGYENIVNILEFSNNIGKDYLTSRVADIAEDKEKENAVTLEKLTLIVEKEVLPKYKLLNFIVEEYEEMQKEHLKHYIELFK